MKVGILQTYSLDDQRIKRAPVTASLLLGPIHRSGNAGGTRKEVDYLRKEYSLKDKGSGGG